MSVEREGVVTVEKIVNHMGLIFREQPIDDYGIDAQIETVKDGYATGRLIAVQIKSGESYIKVVNDEYIVYHGQLKHYKYWLNHTLPVILVIYDPKEDACYWNEVNESTAELSENGWKINIPLANRLENSREELIKIAERQTEYEMKFNSFLLSKPWMNEIVNGNKNVLCVGEWINKTSGKGDFDLKIIDENGIEKEVYKRTIWGFGCKPYIQVFRELFPWADFKIDIDFYEEYDMAAIADGDYEAAMQTYPDSVGAKFNINIFDYEYPANSPSITEWMKDENNIRPYRVGAGEVAFYQLVLQLNDVAKAFLTVEEYMNKDEFHYDIIHP